MSRSGSILRIPAAARGPQTSGNGGWTSGAVAERLLEGLSVAAAVRVRLSAPPPLERDLTLAVAKAADGAEGLRLTDADIVIAEAMPAPETPPIVPPQTSDPERSFTLAELAGGRFPGLVDHPFPECFACGTRRADGEALRLRPGPVGDGSTSTAWVPHPGFDAGDGTVAVPTMWAALDCPGGWSADLPGRPMVLGTMTAQIWRLPRIGERCVVRGRAEPTGGRTVPAWTTMYGAGGEVIGVASQIWVTITA